MAVADGPDVEGLREIAVNVGFDKVSAVKAEVLVVEVVDAAGTHNSLFECVVGDVTVPDGEKMFAVGAGDAAAIGTHDGIFAAETDGPPADVDGGHLAEVCLDLFERLVIVVYGFAAKVAGIEEDGVVVKVSDFAVAVAQGYALGRNFYDINV